MKLKYFGLFLCVLLFLSSPAKVFIYCENTSKPVWKNPPEIVVIKNSNSSNGDISYLFQFEPTSKITVFQIFVKGGKRAVPVSLRGLCAITTALSVEMPDSETIGRLMTMGSSLFYQVEGDFSVISIRSLTEHIEETVKILSNVLKKPILSSLRISNSKKQMAYREKREEDSPEQLMIRAFFEAFSGETQYCYGGSIYGNADSRKSIKRKNVLAFHKQFFNRSNMVISVSSDLSKPEISTLVGKYFGPIPSGEPILPAGDSPPALSIPQKKSVFIKKDQVQALISFGILFPGANSKNYARLYMLDNLLGKGVGSKLWTLRSQKELAYNPNSSFIQMKDAGLLLIYLKTDSSKRNAAYSALKEIIVDIHKNGISPEELLSSAERSKADFLRQNETKAKRTYNMGFFESIGLKAGFLESFFSEVSAAAPDDFNRFIKDALNPDRLIEVIIGPEDIDRIEK